jgi:hypothetical protein
MATNYSAWNKWDEESASKDCEKRWEEEKIETEFIKSRQELHAETASVQESALRNAEVLRSRVKAKLTYFESLRNYCNYRLL